jgi:hypothetical protein
MRPAARAIHENRTVASTISGRVSLAMKLQGGSKGILHGEAMAIVMARVCADNCGDKGIISDHRHPANDKWLRKASTTDGTWRLKLIKLGLL